MDIFFVRARETASEHAFFENLVDVKGFPDQMQLPRVSHREREQAFHNPRQFLELIVEYTKSLAIFLRAPWFREQQLCLAVKNCELECATRARRLSQIGVTGERPNQRPSIDD